MPNLIGVAPTFPSYAVPEPSMASPKTMKHKTDDCTTLRGRPSVRPLHSEQTSDLQSGKFQTCPPPGQVRSVGRGNNKAVSVKPSAPQPSPPMPSIRLRTCETWGFLPRRLLRSAILTPCPQNDSGVRSAHEPTGNLQDCPDHTARHIYRHSITAVLQDTYQEPFPQAHLIKNSIPFRITSRHINRLTHTQPFTADVRHIHKGSQQFPAVSFLMTAPLRSMPSASRHLHNIIRPLIV